MPDILKRYQEAQLAALLQWWPQDQIYNDSWLIWTTRGEYPFISMDFNRQKRFKYVTLRNVIRDGLSQSWDNLKYAI